MIEYLYNAIRATAGENIIITAKITDDSGAYIDEVCNLKLFDNDKEIITVSGIYNGELWDFIIPAEDTKDLRGRYFYSISHRGNSISFREPIYLM
ncbi:MAG: hypothetical protein IJO73_04905 [Clostridia bacterium]|nr:hypothetical protein [Clostridia bacterium]